MCCRRPNQPDVRVLWVRTLRLLGHVSPVPGTARAAALHPVPVLPPAQPRLPRARASHTGHPGPLLPPGPGAPGRYRLPRLHHPAQAAQEEAPLTKDGT